MTKKSSSQEQKPDFSNVYGLSLDLTGFCISCTNCKTCLFLIRLLFKIRFQTISNGKVVRVIGKKLRYEQSIVILLKFIYFLLKKNAKYNKMDGKSFILLLTNHIYAQIINKNSQSW